MTRRRDTQALPDDGLHVIVGMGKTGLSCARYLARRGVPLAVVDSRRKPPMLDAFRTQLPNVAVHTGAFDAQVFHGAAQVLLSPGVSPQDERLRRCLPPAVRLRNDTDLFCRVRERSRPLVAVTGTNAKSTVVSLLAQLARRAGRRMKLGGNIGTPALDLLQEDGAAGKEDRKDGYILELSSFQLELMSAPNADIAAVLNVSADHLDRHGDMENYASIKQRIYAGCRQAVYNRADPATHPAPQAGMECLSFGLDAAPSGAFGLRQQANRQYLCYGRKLLMPVQELPSHSSPDVENALAALALGRSLELPMEAMLEGLKEFSALPHRCRFLGRIAGVDCYDDSKATNVGAACAALRGMAERAAGRVLLIAGGQSKGAHFAPLAQALEQCGRMAFLIGADAALIEEALVGVVPTERHTTLEGAVQSAFAHACPGDVLLLSPACASLDMFDSFAERGQRFAHALREQKMREQSASRTKRRLHGGEEAHSCHA